MLSPPEFQSPLIMWGPGFGAIVIFLVFPQMRSRFLSLPGSSWKLGYDLVVWGFSCLGEELGWRGFFQGALRLLGRIRSCLLLSLMWTAWHFTATWSGLISHLYTLLPSLAALSFGLAFLTERTGSLALATTVHALVERLPFHDGDTRWLSTMTILPNPALSGPR